MSNETFNNKNNINFQIEKALVLFEQESMKSKIIHMMKLNVLLLGNTK